MTPIYERETRCPVCGDVVPQTGKGRPRTVHNDPENGKPCRQIQQQMEWLETLVSERCEKTAEMRTYIKSNLQRIANFTNGWK